MPVDATRLVDFFDGELNALQVLKTVALLPGTGCSNYVGLFGCGASRQREKCDRPHGFGQQLPPPHSQFRADVSELTRSKLYRSLNFAAHLLSIVEIDDGSDSSRRQ